MEVITSYYKHFTDDNDDLPFGFNVIVINSTYCF